ncbi:tubulin/FtsZ family protein [Halopenitus sp. POP-27]|uniref:tubulin/FtsZ family protein n=1 Tax=Halopenitus sp. POP-27 TaxID=2994425 RepID=UPI002468286E|nr:tubulin/FtsZ family protein [Halopenitus sp. POP-27]
MELALVGVGATGSRVVDCIREIEAETGRTFTGGNAIVCDISRSPTDDVETVPEDRRVLIGDTHPQVTVDGVDGGPDIAAEVTRGDLPEIRRALDAIDVYDADGVLVAAGLGSATGSGAGSVLVEELQATYDEPVYALGVLPADEDGDAAALNAARAIRTIVPAAASTITFDHDAWLKPEAENREDATRALARRICTLFAAGERDSNTIAENAVDSSDVVRTLEPGGIVSIGHATTDVESGTSGLFARLLSWFGYDSDEPADRTTDAAKVNSLVQQATTSRLTVPCDVASAERALVVLSGPPSALSRRGFESARQWLEEEADTVEILAGDDPRDRSSTLEALVVLSNVTDVPRIDDLQRAAVATQRDDGEAAATPPSE